MSGAIAPDRNEPPVSLFVGFAGKFDSVAGSCRGNDVDLQSLFAQPRESRPGKLGRAAATGGGINDRKELMPQSRFIPSKEMLIPVRA
jgi:hypothetical protein